MSSNDSSSDLDSRISAIVESTVGRMRDELVHRIQDTESRLRNITGRMSGDGASAAAPTGDATTDLFDAVVAMDRGGSQQEVLAALLEGVGRFAGRAALFLTRSDGAQGWGSYGFENSLGDMQEVVLSYSEGPLATLAEGRGCVPLTDDECGDLCRQMGAAPGAEGLLVPFVLRDRLAAALYVDRFADEPPLGRRSLQLLAYVGAQTVEGLALRQRSETPTLQVASEGAAEPGVALWEPPAAEQPEAAEPPAPEPPATEPELAEPPLDEPSLDVTEPEEMLAAPPTEMTLEELAEEDAPSATATEPMPAMETEIETAAEDEWDVPAEPMDEPAVEPEPPPAELAEEPTQPLESLAEPAAEAPEEESQPSDATAGAGFSTVEVEPPPEPTEIKPPAESQPAAAGETTEVRPPTDVSGPGWAFTSSRAVAETGDDAQHEEARRLARLLVTEIKLYNEEQVEEGRRSNDIYPRLREDIDRSRQIFDERVADAVREETDYFHEEMVRILAGGNAEALGL